jgi:hypothetical protein
MLFQLDPLQDPLTPEWAELYGLWLSGNPESARRLFDKIMKMSYTPSPPRGMAFFMLAHEMRKWMRSIDSSDLR